MKARLVLALAVLGLLGGVASGCGAEDTTPAPATQKALAAVAVDDLGITPSSYGLAPDWYHPGPLKVELRWHPGGTRETHRLALDARADRDSPGCPPRSAPGQCEYVEAGTATAVLRWEEEAPEEDPGFISLDWWRKGERHTASYSGEQITGDPRTQKNLPVSVDDLLHLLADKRFGTTSTRAMVDADLAKWPKDTSEGDMVPATAATVARRVQDAGAATPRSGAPADVSMWGAGAVGVVLEYPGRELTVVQVPVSAPRRPQFLASWHTSNLRDDPAVEVGWKTGAAKAIWRDEAGGVWVVASVRDARITQDPRPRWVRPGRPGHDVQAIAGWHSSFSTYELTAEASQTPSWFRD